MGARLLARRAGRDPARARRRHVDERTADAADHHRVRGRRRRPAPQPAAHLPRRADPRARGAVVAVVPAVRRPLDERARRRSRRSCCSSCCCCCRRRQLQFARLNVGAPHRTRLDRPRHRARHGRAVRRDGDRQRCSCRPTNLNRFALGMCTALVALSLVPLIGWAGQVSLAPLAFAGIGAVAYTRLGGAHGNVYAVILAALVVAAGRRAARAPGDAAPGSLSRARDARVRVDGRARVLHRSRSRSAPQSRPAGRLQLLGMRLRRHPDVPAPRHRGVRDRRRSASSRSGAARSGGGSIALRDSEAASSTVGVNVLETKVAVFMLSAGMAGFAGAFLAQYYETINQAQFAMLAGLPDRARARDRRRRLRRRARCSRACSGSVSIIIQETWHLSLWSARSSSSRPGSPRSASSRTRRARSCRSARASRRCCRGARTRRPRPRR